MKTYIGIDPSFREGGFALCWLEPAAGERSESGYAVRFERFETYTDFVEWMFQYRLYRVSAQERELVFCIEDSNLQSCTFDKTGNKGIAARKSRNVGINQAASKLAGDMIARYAPEAVLVRLSPLKKGGKMAALEFEEHMQLSGFTLSVARKLGRKNTTSQDERDAYKLAVHAKSRKLTL